MIYIILVIIVVVAAAAIHYHPQPLVNYGEFTPTQRNDLCYRRFRTQYSVNENCSNQLQH